MYDSYYGLSARPFQLTPDPRFYFESTTHRKALSYLGYGLAQGEGFIVITGEIGAGKTTLVGHLRSTIDPSRLTVAQIVTTQLGGNELLFAVARSFSIDTTNMDKPAVLQAIEQFLQAEARAGRRSLLIVDETQNLDVQGLEELRMLSNFQLGASPLLQIFLLGQPEFRTVLRTSPALEQLRQRVIATHHLEGMAPAELRKYIEHRMRKVGWHGRPGFDSDMIETLYDMTDGVPRKVNNLVNRLLLLGAIQQADRITLGMLHTVLTDLTGESDDNRTEELGIVESGIGHELSASEPIAEELYEADTQIAVACPEEAAVSEPDSVEPEEEFAMPPEDARLFDIAKKAGEFEREEPRVVTMPVMKAVPDPENETEADAAIFAAPEATVQAKPGTIAEPVATAKESDAERIERLEARIAEQERAVRRTITMLIEWLESDKLKSANRHRAA